MRIRVATVAETREPWLSETRLLFASLIGSGGRCAKADRTAYFIGDPPSELRRSLEQLDVDIRTADPVHSLVPHANKLRMLEEPERYDVLCALDTDILVTGDFSHHLNGRLRAKPVDVDPIEEWDEIFEQAGLDFPAERVSTTTDGKDTIPYFNSGVLFIPAKFVLSLRERWMERLKMPMPWPSVQRAPFTRDQIALTLALFDIRANCDPLPIGANFPTHIPVAGDTSNVWPELVHHHHLVSRRGDVCPTAYRSPNKAIRASGAAAARVLGVRSRVPYGLRVLPGSIEIRRTRAHNRLHSWKHRVWRVLDWS